MPGRLLLSGVDSALTEITSRIVVSSDSNMQQNTLTPQIRTEVLENFHNRRNSLKLAARQCAMIQMERCRDLFCHLPKVLNT